MTAELNKEKDKLLSLKTKLIREAGFYQKRLPKDYNHLNPYNDSYIPSALRGNAAYNNLLKINKKIADLNHVIHELLHKIYVQHSILNRAKLEKIKKYKDFL